MKHEYIQKIVNDLESEQENSVLVGWVEEILIEMHNIATEEANAKHEEAVNDLQRQINDLEHPTLKMHTKKYREQCEALQTMSEAEREAFNTGYNWACKVAQQQILALSDAHEATESSLEKKLESLTDELKKQAETLKGASKSWAYTEREQNILLSQHDDIEKILKLVDPTQSQKADGE